MNVRFLIVYIVLLFVSGCEAVRYAEPTGDNTSKVRFATKNSDVVTVYEYDNRECQNERLILGLKNGWLAKSEVKRKGIPLWDYHDNAAKELFVLAGIEHTYMFRYSWQIGDRYERCAVPVHFTFEKGRDYELLHHLCFVTVYEIEDNNGKSEKSKLVQFSSKGENVTQGCYDEFTDLI